MRRHLTYANVIATLAMFVALATGGAFAASKIGTNDIENGAVTAKKLHTKAVTRKKLKDGAASGAKVADDSLTRAQILESSLGRVPSANHASAANSATNADHADTADSLGGITSDGFLQGLGSEESTAAGAAAGASIDT